MRDREGRPAVVYTRRVVMMQQQIDRASSLAAGHAPRSGAGKSMPPAAGPVAGAFAFVAIAGALVSGNGRYTHLAIALMIGAFAGLILLARETLRAAGAGRVVSPAPGSGDAPDASQRTWERVLAVALLLCLALGLATKPGEFLTGPYYRVVQAVVNLALGGAVWASFLSRQRSPAACRAVFYAAVAAGFGLRFGMLLASPAPVIDVFVEFQESARHLLAGLNPYTVPVSDVYQGTRDYGYQLLGYAYLPANLLLQTAAYALAGDFRYGCIAAEAVAAFALYRVARPAPGRLVPMLVVLLFLFHPRGLFVIEQGWTEPFIAGTFALFLLLRDRRPESLWPAAAYGYMLSLKQYLVYFVIHLFMIERRGRAVAVAAATGFLTIVPFLVWDPASFYTYGVRFQLETTFRPDGLTIVALLYRLFGLTAGKWLAALVGFGVAVCTYRRFLPLGLVGYLLAVTLTTFAIFLFGSQAFCNYYYLVSVLCLFVFAVHARPA
jgi:hypothetical protein